MNSFYEEFKDTTHYQKNNAFLKACIDGDLEKVKYLLISPEISDHANIDVTDSESDYDGYLYACKHGWLDIVKYLLTSPDLKYHTSIYSRNRGDDTALQLACRYGHIDIIEYLIKSSDLQEHLSIADNDYWAVNLACEYGKSNVIEYLFNSGCLKDYNISLNGQDILRSACEYGHLEIVRFLLTNTDLKNIADLDSAFLSIRWSESLEIAQYFIIDLNIPKNKEQMDFLWKNQESFARNVENMFVARELGKELNDNMQYNSTNKKIKI